MSLLDATASAINDRGVIHQLLTALGVGNSAAHTAQVLGDGPVRVLLVLVVAFVLSRLVARISNRLVRSFRLVSPLVGATPRGADRAKTLAGVFTSIFRAIIWVIALLTILGEMGIQLGPFVATATVVGAAVGFGAQTLVKDFLSGVLILAEDQYGVGDSVTIASSKTTGVVEGVNLRTTRIRSLDGVIWYVPNGDIRAVGNNSASDSQALVDLVLPHGVDLDRAGRIARQAAAALATDATWGDQIAGPPTFAGIQAEDHEGVTVRVAILTRPGQDAPVARQARLRILEAWRVAGIGFGSDPDGAPPDLPTPALVGVSLPTVDPNPPAIGGAVGVQPPPPTPRSATRRPHLFRHGPAAEGDPD